MAAGNPTPVGSRQGRDHNPARVRTRPPGPDQVLRRIPVPGRTHPYHRPGRDPDRLPIPRRDHLPDRGQDRGHIHRDRRRGQGRILPRPLHHCHRLIGAGVEDGMTRSPQP